MNTNSATDAMTGNGAQSAARRLAWLALCIGSTLPLLAAAADTTYYVGTTNDIVDATTNCTTSGNTTCSLREAVNAINAVGSGTHNVYLPTGTITITGAANESLNAGGDYDLRSATVQTVNFIGAGSANTIINGNGLDRIFETTQASVALTFSDLTLQNGNVAADGGCVKLAGTSLSLANTVVTGCQTTVAGRGGGVYINLAGVITITNSTLTGNSSAGAGGAVYSAASVSINSTAGTMVFSGNTAGASGGAIYAATSLISGGGSSFSFTSNSSTSGSGGAIYTGSGFDIMNASFGGSAATANRAGVAGGAVYANGGAGIVSSFKSSSATYNTAQSGGGVYSQSYGTLNIDNSTISNNTSTASGGGVYAGILTISNALGTTYIENNTSGNAGAGVYVNINSSTTVITGAVIRNNRGPDVSAIILNPRGGGFSTNGAATITDSEITDNVIGGEGGGVAAVGLLTISGSTIARNQSTGLAGGGIYGSTTVNITDSTIDGNISKGNGGGLAPSGTTTLTRSTISNNTSQTGGGGGLYTPGGTVNLYNSTVSSNQSVTTGGGIYTKYCSIINSTITLNSATNASTAGGVYKSVACTYTNTIIASNTGGGAAVNCGGWGTLTSGGYNIESANTCGFASTGDMPNTDPLLSILFDNGGPTKTHALQIGSPAIDKGNNAVCAAAPINNVDQRGKGRPLDGDAIPGAVCDIGAYEGLVVRPDHIKITHDGNALTCRTETVTITACANSACTVLYTDGANVTLTPGGQTFMIDTTGINSAAIVQQSTVGTATLSASSVPVASGTPPTRCWNTVTRTDSCDMVFSDSGIYVKVENHTSCNDEKTTIEALQGCVPVFQNMKRAVKLYSTYLDPDTGTQAITASTGAVSTTAPGTIHNLDFDATGKATITVKYPDAGQVMLIANATAPNNTALTGSSTFVVAPASFEFSGIPAAPLTAGVPFNATVTAKNACATPATTPNFGKETSPESATVTFTKCQPTGDNAVDGTFSGSVGSFSNGAASATNLNWSEVGNGDLGATLTSGSYLGSGLTVIGNTGTGGTACNGGGVGNVGAFIPDHFITTVADGCAGCGFTYSGQPFTVTVTAMNGLATPTKTVNYDGTASTTPNFANNVTLSDANATATPVGVLGVSAAAMGVTVTSPTLTVPKADFTKGDATLTDVPTYTFNTSPTAPTAIKIRAVDAVNASVTSSGFMEGTTIIHSGRVKIGNAHGSELLPLPMTATVQYYDGANWLTSTTDSVTSLTLGLSNYQCKTGCPWTTTPAPESDTVDTGALKFKLLKPTGGGTGSVDVSVSAPGYLLTGSNGAAVNPSRAGRATFGVYKGANEFIYMRENY